MPYSKEEVNEQADIDFICKKHNLGRYDLIQVVTAIARNYELRPHDALKRLVDIDDLPTYLEEMKSNQVDKEFKRQLRKKNI
jgi:hypothetical protein